MDRKVVATTLAGAGLLAGAFLAGGLLFGNSDSSATGAAGPTGSTGAGQPNVLATATVQPSATSTPVITITSPTTTPSTGGSTGAGGGTGSGSGSGGGTGTLNPAPATQVPTTVPPTAIPPTAVPPTPIPPTPVPPTPTTIIIPTPIVLEPVNDAPYVDSVSPDDGVNGIAINSNIEVTFSEKMKQASAEAAFSILPNVSGSFSWDVSGTVMTFNPDANFDYNTDVKWEIASSAMDSFGLEMEKGASGGFSVLRKSTLVLSAIPSHDGHVYAPPVAANPKVVASDLSFRVGTWMRGFLSFDFSELPADTTYISEAFLEVQQVNHSGGAYGAQTGNLLVTSVPYGNLGMSDFAMPALEICWVVCGPANVLLSSNSADVSKTTEVTAFVRRDWNEGMSLTQLRLQFEKENAGAGPSEWAEFSSAESGFLGPKLTITVLHK